VPTLVLLRHAEAEPQRADDLARRLTARGREQAAQLRRWLQEHRVDPTRVLVSPAARARETWELAGVGSVQAEQERRLYDASEDELLEVMAEAPAATGALVLVGHNPSVERLAWVLDDSAAARERTDRGMGTAGAAVLELPSWDAGHGRLTAWRG
jgi:phosphohistidine phosphatase